MKRNRILAFLIALLLCLTLAPGAVLAEEEPAPEPSGEYAGAAGSAAEAAADEPAAEAEPDLCICEAAEEGHDEGCPAYVPTAENGEPAEQTPVQSENPAQGEEPVQSEAHTEIVGTEKNSLRAVPLAALGGAAKGFISKNLRLTLEQMAAEGNPYASALLPSMYTATDMTINQILATAQETLEAVQEVDREVDALTVKIDALYDAVKQGFAQGQYDAAAEKIDEVYLRVQPLYERYLTLTENAGNLTESGRAAAVENFVHGVNLVYGTNPLRTFASDLSLLHQAMYSPSGRTTLVDAKIAYDKTVYPFEHQCVEGATEAFSYGTGVQTMLLKVYQEYAAFVTANPDAYPDDTQAALYTDAYNYGIGNINTQAESCAIGQLMQPEEIQQTVTLRPQTSHSPQEQIQVYRVKSNDTGRYYLIEKSPMRMGDKCSYRKSGAHYYEMDYSCESLDERWYIPRNAADLMSMFPSDVTNPAAWLANEGGLSIGQSDVILYEYIRQRQIMSVTYADNKYIDYTVGIPAHDASPLNTPDELEINALDVYEGKMVSYPGRTDSIPMGDTMALRIFFDANAGAGSIPRDDTGAYAPTDITALPDVLYLEDGDVLDLRGVNSTDFGGRIIYASGEGDMRILSDAGKELSHLTLYIQQGATLTAENLRLADTSSITARDGENTLLFSGELDAGKIIAVYNKLNIRSVDGLARLDAGEIVGYAKSGGVQAALSIENAYLYTRRICNIRGFDLIRTDVTITGGANYDFESVTGTYCDGCNITLASGKVKDVYMDPLSGHGGTYVLGKMPVQMEVYTSDVKDAKSDSNIYFSMRVFEEWTGETNITDLASGNNFGRGDTDYFTAILDVPGKISTEKFIRTDKGDDWFLYGHNQIRLRTTGKNGWHVGYIKLSSPFWGDVSETLEINDWIDNKDDKRWNVECGKIVYHNLSSSNLTDSLRTVESGGSLVVRGNHDGHVLSERLIEALRRYGASLHVNSEDTNVVWKIDGSRMSGGAVPVKLGVRFDEAQIEGLKDALRLVLAHDGELPGGLSLRFNAEALGFEPGSTIYLYPETLISRDLSAPMEATVDEEGFCEIEIQRADAVILSSTPPPVAGDDDFADDGDAGKPDDGGDADLDDLPDAGDNPATNSGLWIGLMLLSVTGLAACAAVWRRRKQA